MTKRPVAIYLLATFYLALLMLSLTFLLSEYINPTTFLHNLGLIWALGLPDTATHVIILISCLIYAGIIHGLLKGRPLGRNLSMVVALAIMVLLGSSLSKVLTIVSANELIGWNLLQTYIMLAVLGIASFVFYLALRPEVGRFCKVYPDK